MESNIQGEIHTSLEESIRRRPGKKPICIDEILIRKYRAEGMVRKSTIIPELDIDNLARKKYNKFVIQEMKYFKEHGKQYTEFVLKMYRGK